MDIKKSWNLLNVYDLMIIALLVLTVYNLSVFRLPYLLPTLAMVLAAVILDLAVGYVKEKKRTDGRAKRVIQSFPKSALITGLILSVIVEGNILFLILIATIAILSKHTIRIKSRHIFNPANFGLFVALLAAAFLPVPQSWWGTSNLLLVLVLGLVVVFKLKRLHLVLPFLAVHAAMMFIILSLNPNQLTSHLVSGSLIFFTFYMLVEPVTSPAKMKGRLLFGVLAGIFAAVLYVFWLPAMLVGALFFADMIVPVINKFSTPRSKSSVELPPNAPVTNPNW